MSSERGRAAVLVSGVSKCFHTYPRPSHRLWHALSGGRVCRGREVWAVRDVSFEIEPGEAVGVVGRNGAGKSTLLQLVAGVLTPSSGTIERVGRLAPLLQLGAGFHPDFTGRENVFLSAAIHGLTREETRERFDEIAAFADIGAFLDQPVRTYSTGMRARLGFAVAMATEPDLLIVDEVLAVGDLLFQQKCLTRIQQMRDRGMSLLLVSHSTDRINSVCDRALFLERGNQRFFGASDRCTDLYLKALRAPTAAPPPAATPAPATSRRESAVVRRQSAGVDRYGNGEVRIADVTLLDADGKEANRFEFGQSIGLRARYHATVATERLNVSFLIRDDSGVNLTGTMTHDEGCAIPPVAPGETGAVLFSFRNCLRPGHFGVSVALTELNPDDPRKPLLYDQIDGVAAFSTTSDPRRPVHYRFDAKIRAELL